VPSEVVVERPRVVTIALPMDVASTLPAEREASVFEALLGFGSSSFDVIVVGLDQFEPDRARELASALVRQPVTQGVALVGVSEDPVRRREFLAGGADLALAGAHAIPDAVAFVCGTEEFAERRENPVAGDRQDRPSGTFPRMVEPAAAKIA
jgi:hypothetical protein